MVFDLAEVSRAKGNGECVCHIVCKSFVGEWGISPCVKAPNNPGDRPRFLKCTDACVVYSVAGDTHNSQSETHIIQRELPLLRAILLVFCENGVTTAAGHDQFA